MPSPRIAILTVAVAAALAGCAASPGSGYTGGGSAAVASTSRCGPGEISVCAVRTPHRVSDGRYGFRGNTRKQCVCEPERDLEALEGRPLPDDQR